MEINTYRQASDMWLNHSQQLKGFLIAKTKDPILAEEIGQEVLLKMIDTCCSGQEIRYPKAWVLTIARNQWIDHLRASDRIQQSPAPDPGEEAKSNIYHDLEEFIQPLLSFLPDKYRIPLQLDLEGVKQSEIAHRLSLSLTATKSRIQRARKLLKKEIETCFFLEGECCQAPRDFRLKDSCAPLQEFKKSL